jgi:hypothetical protein
MRTTSLLAVLSLISCGCVSTSLEHYALNQALTVSDMRYKQVMHDLAVVADNRGSLPSFALTAGGLANVTHTVSIDTATLWDAAVKGFSKETLAAFGQHNPELQWTLDPIVSEPQLEALGYACMWALDGPPPPGSRAMEALRELTIEDIYGCPDCDVVKLPPGYRFGVVKQLCSIPHGWVHIGSKGCIPKDAVYHASHGKTSVWVTREGLPHLSDFTLVVLDIATVDPKSLVIPTPTVSVTITEAANPRATAIEGTLSEKERAALCPQQKERWERDNGACLPLSNTFVTADAKDGNKITETWNVCQVMYGCTGGPITLSRPKALAQRIREFPRIIMGDITVGVTKPVTGAPLGTFATPVVPDITPARSTAPPPASRTPSPGGVLPPANAPPAER